MGNKDILNLLNDKEFQRTLVGTYKCLKTSLREELQDVEDSIIISYLKAYIIYEYEKIEDIDHLRFLEHGVDLKFSYVESESISVDTPKDLEFVIGVIKKKIEEHSPEIPDAYWG